MSRHPGAKVHNRSFDRAGGRDLAPTCNRRTAWAYLPLSYSPYPDSCLYNTGVRRLHLPIAALHSAMPGETMRPSRRKFLQLASGAIVSPAVSRIARAQAYPSRPITLVVPYPAGGPTDTIARLIAERMRVSLGQPIVIENVSGGGGT